MARKAAATPKAPGATVKAPRKAAQTAATASKAAPAKPKRVSRKTTPTPETLTELGLKRLIGLVLAETARNPGFKKLVTAAVASLQGPDAVAALIDRRLTALERGQGYIDWQKQRAFAADLDAMLTTVVNELATLDPGSGLERLIRFLGGAGDVLGRSDDSSGRIHGVYERAADAAATLIVDLTGPEAAAMSLRLVARLETDGYGLVERLLHDLIPRLPEAALASLDAALSAATPPPSDAPGRERDWRAEAERSRLVRMRQALTDRTCDVDAFIDLETERASGFPNGVPIAERLLAAGRAGEALAWVRRPQARSARIVTHEDLVFGAFDTSATERARAALEVRILDALGETETAQALRWRQFEACLDRDMLRAYLAKLPDFEDDAALDRAFAVVEAHPDRYRALAFFTHWPHPARAARLVAAHRGSWDGGRYEILAPAAEALERTEARAATDLYRLLIDAILERSRTSAYGYAARYLTALGHLAGHLEPGSISPDPQEYREGLRRRHGRKAAFWGQVRD